MMGGSREYTRRRTLQILGAGASAVIAGCSTSSENTDDPDSPSPKREQSNSTEEREDEDNQNNEGTGLLEETHSATELDQVMQELEQDSVTLNFIPEDENAEYTDSVIFNKYETNEETVLDVEIDLNQAITQRHIDNYAAEHPHVQEFVENIDDPSWRTQILREAGVDNPEGRIDWDTYTDPSLSFGERMNESNNVPLWYAFENSRFGSVSSANNQYKAQALQGMEKKQDSTHSSGTTEYQATD